MFRKVLVGFLDSEHGVDALALGRKLATACSAPMAVATAPADDGDDLGQVVRSHGADLLVLGSSHRAGLGRVVPGATIDHLLADPPCAIAVAPPGFGRPDGEPRWRPLDGNGDDTGMRVIGVGFDGSPAAATALEIATQMALRNHSSLRVYTVARKAAQTTRTHDPALEAGAVREADLMRDNLEQAVRDLPSEVRALPVLLRGFEDDQLVKASALGVDLLVLGSRPGGPVRRRLHRSVSNIVLSRAKCPVLIIPTTVAAAVATPV